MLNQFYSQQLEGLFAQFVVRFVRTRHAFFEPRQVIIQGQGIEKWLTLQLAETLGVVSNIKYPYPASFLWTIYSHIEGDHHLSNPWQRSELHWLLIEQIDLDRRQGLRTRGYASGYRGSPSTKGQSNHSDPSN